jgi:hypothetical protein
MLRPWASHGTGAEEVPLADGLVGGSLSHQGQYLPVPARSAPGADRGPAAMRPAPSGPTTATPPQRWPRVLAAVEERLVIVLATAEAALDQQPWSQ